MKILIFTDLHIHPHKKSSERLNDCLKALSWTLETARRRKISNVVFLGDLFHDRQKIDVLAYQKTFEVLEENLKDEKTNLYLLLGNHDLWHYQRLDVSSVNPLRTLPGVTVISEPCVKEISDGTDDFFMGFLPYTHAPQEDLKRVEKEWESSVKKEARRVLGGHIAVDGAVWNLKYNTLSEVTVEHEGDMVRVGPEIFKRWDRVFLGHYHAAQKLDARVEYVGSPLQLSFGEAGQQKHLVIYDTLEDDVEYVVNDFSPRHLIIGEDDIDKVKLEGNFVRLEVDDITSRHMSELRQSLVESRGVGALEIKQRHKDESHVIDDAKSILSDEDKMIERYVEQAAPEGLDKEILIRIGAQICNKAPEG
jgi:DNA repair exonuclease SbcCD nuclease subunit